MIKRIISKMCLASLRKPAYAMLQTARLFRYHSFLFPSQNVLYCPCCGRKFRSFNGWDYKEQSDSFASSRYENIRQDVLCPICRALPRHRILALWCEKHKRQLENSKILYFAPERGMMLWMKRNGITCMTADLNTTADIKLDIQDTGLPDETYDVVIANHVLEHVDDFRKALKEVHRILKQEGMFICSFPIDPKVDLLDEESGALSADERIKRFGQYDHKRVFGMKADQFLTEAGYKVEVIDGDQSPIEILPIIGPADYDINRLFCCRKEVLE